MDPIKLKVKFNKSELNWHAKASHGNTEVFAQAKDPRDAADEAIELLFDLIGHHTWTAPALSLDETLDLDEDEQPY